MPTRQQVAAAVDAYVRGLSARDRDRWLQLFTDDAVLVDPVPSDPVTGRSAIAAFYDGLAAMSERLVVVARQVVVCGAEAAVTFTTVAGPAAGGGVAFDGVLVLTVADDGRVSEVRS
ncbi:MAG TPA: SgcJ/EcaC family oxidoreductase, partial [Acidimicrobiales bacterium]|nr:SgcJ/EcaC family oxidoreductase [Acidimicrobiales bacterium]